VTVEPHLFAGIAADRAAVSQYVVEDEVGDLLDTDGGDDLEGGRGRRSLFAGVVVWGATSLCG
jgi:hypothetical protein